jgi:hypothetical protein
LEPSFDSGYQKAKYADIAGYVSGAQVLFIPHATAYLDSGLLHKMNSVTISGGRVTQNSTMKDNSISERESTYTFPGSLWQIFPTGQRSGVGLLISDSTDFTSITNATQSGQCIWKGTVNVPTGGWAVPTIAGYDKSKYIVLGAVIAVIRLTSTATRSGSSALRQLMMTLPQPAR